MPSQNTKPAILVVDDEPDNVLLLATILEPYYAVKVATQGERALKIAISDAPPALILLDIMMAGIDGYEVCRQLKANPATRDIPVLFVTGKTESEDEVKGLALGAVDYIAKPITPAVVLARVSTHLALQQARQQVEKSNEILNHEKEVVENIVSKMRSSAPFDHRHVRFQLSSVDRTAGDIVLSAYRPDGTQHVLVGDFSGHGLPAAVAGPLVSYIFYRMTADGYALEEILAELNRTLQRQLPTQIYMAACAVAINAERTQASFWNHGLPPALIYSPAGVMQRITATEVPLGIADPITISPSATGVNLKADEIIYIFSDGMTEVPSPSGDEFGQARLEELLTLIATASMPLSHAWECLVAFHGDDEFPDDTSLVELRVN